MPGPLSRSLPERLAPSMALVAIPGRVYIGTLAGNIALDATYPNVCKLDPDGSARDVTLDAEASSEGIMRTIINGADGAENLVVKDDSPATLATLAQNTAGVFYCDGTSWVLVYKFTIALS